MSLAEENHQKIEAHVQKLRALDVTEDERLKLAVSFGMSLAVKAIAADQIPVLGKRSHHTD